MSHQSINPETQPEYTMRSASAVSSMIFGIASPLGVCTCFSPLVTSLIAIVMGHISLSKIKQSNGRLTGKGNAIAGLILGYIFFPLSLVLIYGYYSNLEGFSNIRSNAAELSPMSKAESELVGLRDGATAGNSPQAKELAGSYERLLSNAIQETVTNKDGTKVHDRVSVNCHLTDDSVCFLVKIPGYRKYAEEAKDKLATMAWQCGRIATSDAGLPEDIDLGIGLKGILLYGSVMVGSADSEFPRSTAKSEIALKRFYPKAGLDNGPEN